MGGEHKEITGMTRRTIVATALTPFLLLVAALAAPATQAGGGCHGNDGSAYTEGDGNTVIRMDVCSFSPTINRVAVGTTVRFLNTSNIEHAVVGRSGTWGSAILSVGSEYAETFDAAGTYPFSCPLHPGMVGAIVVGADAGAAAAPAANAASGPTVTSPDAQAVAAATTTGSDPAPLAAAALAGLGLGAVVGVLGASVIATRRRRSAG
jgi:plastocyanin